MGRASSANWRGSSGAGTGTVTHLGDQNISALLLMALSGHKRLATLQRHVKSSQAAVATLMAASDPDRRPVPRAGWLAPRRRGRGAQR